jgi:acetyl esterase/lipase
MRCLAILILVALAPRIAAAQTCQSVPGVVYGSYVDAAGQTQKLLLDMLLPTGATSPARVVVWVHGGGWRSGSRAPIPTRAANLCPRGCAVVSIDYRLTGVARWPAQIHDVRAAVRWLRAHAAQYNLDPTRVAAWGNSSGGHLAAVLATAGGVRMATVGSVGVDLEARSAETFSTRAACRLP